MTQIFFYHFKLFLISLSRVVQQTNFQLLLVFPALCLYITTAQANEVESFNPVGSPGGVKSVEIKFKRAVVSMNEPRTHINPMRVKCENPSEVRERESNKGPLSSVIPNYKWINETTLNLIFDAPLKESALCYTESLPNMKDVYGELIEPATYILSINGPKVLGTFVYYGRKDHPLLAVLVDTPVDESSIAENTELKFRPYESTELQVYRGADKATILNEVLENINRFKSADQRVEIASAPTTAEPVKDRLILLQPKSEWPGKNSMYLWWDGKVRSKLGVASRDPQYIPIEDLSEFEIDFSCRYYYSDMSYCDPQGLWTLSFSQFVSEEKLKMFRLISENGDIWLPEVGATPARYFQAQSGVSFGGPFPRNSHFRLIFPKDFASKKGLERMREHFGPYFDITTAGFEPSMEHDSDFVIMHPDSDRKISFTLLNTSRTLKSRTVSILPNEFNIEDEDQLVYIIELRSRTAYSFEHNRFPTKHEGDARAQSMFIQYNDDVPTSDKTVEAVFNVAPSDSGPIREYLEVKSPGFHVIEIENNKNEAQEFSSSKYAATSVLITRISAHMRIEDNSAVVWVTDLDSGKPVDGAKVVLHNGIEILGKGLSNRDGLFILNSFAAVCRENDYSAEEPDCTTYAFVQKNQDFAFVDDRMSAHVRPNLWLKSNPYELNPYAPNYRLAKIINSRVKPGQKTTLRFSGLTPRDIKNDQPSDEKESSLVFALIHKKDKHLILVDSVKEHRVSGDLFIDFIVPPDIKTGDYSVYLFTKDTIENNARSPSNNNFFPTFELSVLDQKSGETLEFKPEHDYIKDGGLSFQIALTNTDFYPVAGRTSRLKTDFSAISSESASAGKRGFKVFGARKDFCKKEGSSQPPLVDSREFIFDKSGIYNHPISKLPPLTHPAMLELEVSFLDRFSYAHEMQHRRKVFPFPHIIGLKAKLKDRKQRLYDIEGYVTDTQDVPQPNTQFEINSFFRVNQSMKTTDGTIEESQCAFKPVEKVCEGITDERGLFRCDSVRLESYKLILEASSKHKDGQISTTAMEMTRFEPGKEQFAEQTPIDFEVSVEKVDKKEFAILHFKQPMDAGVALISIAKERVIDNFVVNYSPENPSIKIPIKGTYLPIAYISVFISRPWQSIFEKDGYDDRSLAPFFGEQTISLDSLMAQSSKLSDLKILNTRQLSRPKGVTDYSTHSYFYSSSKHEKQTKD